MLHLRRIFLVLAILSTLTNCGIEDSPRNDFTAFAGASSVGGTTVSASESTNTLHTGIAGIGGGENNVIVSSEGGSSGAWLVEETGGEAGIDATQVFDGTPTTGREVGVDASQPPDSAMDAGRDTATAGYIDAGDQSYVDATQEKDGITSSYHPCPTDGMVCMIMPFGDSITHGTDTPGGYRIELFRLAHSDGKMITFVGSQDNGPESVDGIAFPGNHEGYSGWTIDPFGSRHGISTLVAEVMPQYKPHIVLLMIGTNDAIDDYDMANAPTRLGALIDSIYAQLPDVLIVVAQPIPSRGDVSKGDDPELSNRIKEYNDHIPAVVKARADTGRHILLVDMYTPFNSNKSALFDDQWHPNLDGYTIIGTQWYATIQSLL